MIIIGDGHSKKKEYLKLLSTLPPNEQTIMLGDWGFYREHTWFLKKINCSQHKILFGNHDDTAFVDKKHSMGHFFFDPKFSLFGIRGAFTVDNHVRPYHIERCPDEELGYYQWIECINQYEAAKPRIVISHTLPESILEKLFPEIKEKSKKRQENHAFITEKGLQSLLDIHKPEIWIFGHFHKHKDEVIDGTRFICLEELETFQLPILPEKN